MRCPYCGGLNTDQASFCARCGRALHGSSPSAQPTQQRPSSPAQGPLYPQPQTSPNAPQQRPRLPSPQSPTPMSQVQPPPYRQPAPPAPMPVPAASPEYPPAMPAARGRRQRPAGAAPAVATPLPPRPRAPEAPAPFPPRSLEQLNALETDALEYKVLDESVSYGRKKVVKITYQRCVAWQQVATLLKALRAYQSPDFDCIIILGVDEGGSSVYEFSNGKMQFDQNVRLGSQIIKRYQIETDNGLTGDALRVVLTE